jgi:hypothetical protein
MAVPISHRAYHKAKSFPERISKMCISCGCMMPDDNHGDERYIVMQDIVEAADLKGRLS